MSRSIPQACSRHLYCSSVRQGALSAPFLSGLSPSQRPQCFSTSSPAQSRVGRAKISIPSEVSLRFLDLPQITKSRRAEILPKTAIQVKGPLGELTLNLPPFVTVAHDAERQTANISVEDSNLKHQRSMWGTTRSHLQNYILGVSEGHICILRLVGVGYRASIESTATTVAPEYPGQQFVSLKLGYAHPVELGIPQGVKASTPQPTRILLESVNKEVVNYFAACIREWRRPEPYKGKGIFINNETIKLKHRRIR